MSVKSDLVAAKAPIDTPEKWAQDAGEYGKCYCISTALSAGLSLAMGGRYRMATEALMDVGDFADVEELISFNDDPTTTHADIMALFDRAIEATA